MKLIVRPTNPKSRTVQAHLSYAEIYRTACLFRDAIDATEFDETTSAMRFFPENCCHHASKLLGLYLFDQKYGIPIIISGGHPTDSTAQHHWVRLDGYDIDIAGDQTTLGQPDVVVAICSAWHGRLNGQPLRNTNFDAQYWDAISAREYHGPIYQRILKNVRDQPRFRGNR